MFLSKRGGVYHLFYIDQAGKRRQCSTKTALKAEAVEFLRVLKREEGERRRALGSILMRDFTCEYLQYLTGVPFFGEFVDQQKKMIRKGKICCIGSDLK